MSLLTNKRTVLAKIETTYGTDPSPAGIDAILLKNLTITPISAELVSRDLIRPFLGNSENLLAQKYVQMDFEVEYQGAGSVGVAPGLDPLLRACGMAKSITQVTCSIASAATILTVTRTAHGFVVGDKVLISGCTDTAKNVVVTVASVTSSSVFVTAPVLTATDESPALGAPKLNTSVVYTPISAAFESVTMYYNVDGTLHVMTGAFGTFSLGLNVKQIPTLKFTMTGLYVAPTDAAAAAVDFSKFQIPQIVNTQNTPGFSLFGYSGAMESCSMDLSNDVQYITLVGSENVKIVDRKPAGTLVFEAVSIATKDFFSIVAANTKGDMNIAHGSFNGQKIVFDAPSVNLGNPSYQDSNGVQMLSCPFTVNPISGNDEFTLTFK